MNNSLNKNEDDLFNEIEIIERSKRRLSPKAKVGLERTISQVKIAFQDIIDSFSLPKDVVFKYAR